MSDEPVTATAKATEEIAKATGKGIEVVSGLGRFFDRIFGPTLNEFGGALADKAKYWRASRLLRLEAQYVAACAAIGSGKADRPVEPKFAFALLEAASLESDDSLQDMFANLLANATSKGTGVEDRKAFVSIIQELKPLDAQILSMIYAPPVEFRQSGGEVRTSKFPENYSTGSNGDGHPSSDVLQALWNLVRIACIQPLPGWRDIPSVDEKVILTDLGNAFVRACTIRPVTRV